MITGCSVVAPNLVYAWPTKEEFDVLAVAERVSNWVPDEVCTLLKNDGKQWERRCHSKTIEGAGVMVIFQWFDERQIETTNAGQS